MKNAVPARLFPLCDFLFARTDRPIRLYLLIVCLMLVYLPGYSQPEARRDTFGDAVVVFRPRTVADNNMPMVVTVTRAAKPLPGRIASDSWEGVPMTNRP